MWCSSPDHYTFPLCSNKNKQTKQTNKSCALLSEVRKKPHNTFTSFKKKKAVSIAYYFFW